MGSVSEAMQMWCYLLHFGYTCLLSREDYFVFEWWLTDTSLIHTNSELNDKIYENYTSLEIASFQKGMLKCDVSMPCFVVSLSSGWCLFFSMAFNDPCSAGQELTESQMCCMYPLPGPFGAHPSYHYCPPQRVCSHTLMLECELLVAIAARLASPP